MHMGYEEIPHTADWSIRVWADDLPGLLAESARGMNEMAGVEQRNTPRVTRIFVAEGLDDEDMLVGFLTELVYYAEQENLGFDQFDIEVNDDRLKVYMEGSVLKSLSKAIKAVTYHNLKIEQTGRGLETVIVFDV
jgi:SHS2 domain-containing protein